MDDLLKHASMIKEEAGRLGFTGCGIARAEMLEEDAGHLTNWLNQHYHADMVYMENHFTKRIDPSKLVEGAQSVISVLLNYYPAKTQSDPKAPVLSKYAYGKDYHDVIRGKLKRLLHFIHTNIWPVKGRAFVDSAPVLERAWAARAGLGWIGKNSCLITPETGSFVFIGTLITDLPLPPDKPITKNCGNCNRCIIACPTQAIVAPRIIDARRCIAYLTIENKENIISSEFKGRFRNRVFGCDICQDVCPWNKHAIANHVEEFIPIEELLSMTRDHWYTMSEEEYRTIFKGSAVKRAKFRGLKRNLRFISD